MLTQDRLKHVLSYDPVVGVFFWLRPSTNRLKPGDAAGRTTNKGYRHIMVDGIRYAAHRLAWLWAYGCWPKGEIDHRNGNRDDNRIENLRDVSRSENQQNIAGCRRHSVSRLLGVTKHSKLQWRAKIKCDKNTYHLGLFYSPEEAHAAYLGAKAVLHKAQPFLREEET